MAHRASRTISAYGKLFRREHSFRGFTIVELLIVIVVIAILAAITIVAYNGITDRAKESARVSELAQWKKTSELYKIQNNIECPENYVFVYGNSTLGTSDFCVMKYEAKNVGGVATSQAAGTPWVSISQIDATTQSANAGGHLITEAEWMTIAADVLSVKYNWSGGAVGSGIVYQGHVNNNPAATLAASTDDTDTLSGITGGTGTNSGTNSSRVLYLKSGDAIWDLSGNVWEWTSGTISGAQPGEDGFTSREYPSITAWGNLSALSRPISLSAIPELSEISSWSSSQGIGRVTSSSTATATYGLLRGGRWDNGLTAGALSLVMNGAPSASNPGIGFRVAR